MKEHNKSEDYDVFCCSLSETCGLYESLSEKEREERCKIKIIARDDELSIEYARIFLKDIVEEMARRCEIYRRLVFGDTSDEEIEEILNKEVEELFKNRQI